MGSTIIADDIETMAAICAEFVCAGIRFTCQFVRGSGWEIRFAR